MAWLGKPFSAKIALIGKRAENRKIIRYVRYLGEDKED